MDAYGDNHGDMWLGLIMVYTISSGIHYYCNIIITRRTDQNLWDDWMNIKGFIKL